MFQSDDNANKSRKYNNYNNSIVDPNMKHGMMPMHYGYPMYQNPMMHSMYPSYPSYEKPQYPSYYPYPYSNPNSNPNPNPHQLQL